MGQSVSASETGLAIANQARQRRGWTKTSTARWWQDAHTSRATLRRFWRGERIQQDAFIAICQTVGLDNWQAIAESSSGASGEPLSQPAPMDWGDAPDVEQFYGREPELQQLQTWILQDNAKLINISGLGGSGKTALALALAEQLQTAFERIVWRSANVSIDTLISSLLDTPTTEPGEKQLLGKIQQQRWLIILDDVDQTHLDSLYRFSRPRHRSCFIITSRQPLPTRFSALNRTYHLSLCGLSTAASVKLLQSCGCCGHVHQLMALARIYSYNPLALKLVASTIQTVFHGQPALFLEQEKTILPEPICQLFQQQFETLTPPEKTLLFWLAIWQEPISLYRLQTHLLNPADTVSNLANLLQRSLVTRHFDSDQPSFGLQPMVMTFTAKQLVETVIEELSQAQQQQTIQSFQILRTHCLLRPGTDNILGDQILSQLRDTYQPQTSYPISSFIQSWLQQVSDYSPNMVGYLVFNLNLLENTLEAGV